MEPKLSDSEIIDRLGGTAAVARICDIKPPSVSGWRENGIPQARRQFLELLRPDVFGQPLAEPDATGQGGERSHAA